MKRTLIGVIALFVSLSVQADGQDFPGYNNDQKVKAQKKEIQKKLKENERTKKADNNSKEAMKYLSSPEGRGAIQN